MLSELQPRVSMIDDQGTVHNNSRHGLEEPVHSIPVAVNGREQGFMFTNMLEEPSPLPD